MTLSKLYNYYKRCTPFSYNEAWTLFKIAAVMEAVGWTLLILGIVCKNYILVGNDVPLQIAGRFHGVLFGFYILAVVVLAPSLGWSLIRTLIAASFSVPPYGSIMFERWAYQHQSYQEFKQQRSLLQFRLLAQSNL